MEKAFEFADTWFKMQREWLKEGNRIQRDFIDAFIDAVGKLQDSFLETGAAGRLPGREMSDFYNKWFSTVVSSSRSFADEIIKMQDAFKKAANREAEAVRGAAGGIARTTGR